MTTLLIQNGTTILLMTVLIPVAVSLLKRYLAK